MTNIRSIRCAGLLLALMLPVACQSTQIEDRPGFDSPEVAVSAVVEALRADEVAVLHMILGPAAEELLSSGNEAEDRAERRRFLALYDERHTLEQKSGRTAVLYVGDLEWPFPIPIVKSGDSWFLDTEEGREELLDRRVGRNELGAVRVCRAVVDAQLEYSARDWDDDGFLEYAQKLRSSRYAKDGLYWEGEPESPIGELVAAAEEEGLAPGTGTDAYHGYRFRLLTSQGQHAPGGAYDYMVGREMIGGFALVSYPARYGYSGIMSFITSHDGGVYQKDLGPESETLAKALEAFDPDDSWDLVTEE